MGINPGSPLPFVLWIAQGQAGLDRVPPAAEALKQVPIIGIVSMDLVSRKQCGQITSVASEFGNDRSRQVFPDIGNIRTGEGKDGTILPPWPEGYDRPDALEKKIFGKMAIQLEQAMTDIQVKAGWSEQGPECRERSFGILGILDGLPQAPMAGIPAEMIHRIDSSAALEERFDEGHITSAGCHH